MADKKNFDSIAIVHIDAVFRAAVALAGSRHDAENLVQTTFLKAYQRFGSFKKGTNCRAWLLRILRNTWIDRFRRNRTTADTVPVEDDIIAAPNSDNQTFWSDCNDLLENFSDQKVIDALKQLPDDQRLTLFLVDVEQLSQQEVAEITDVALGTVKSRTSRARAALKQQLSYYAKQMGYDRI